MAASKLATLDPCPAKRTLTSLPETCPPLTANTTANVPASLVANLTPAQLTAPTLTVKVTQDFTVTFWGVRGSVPTPSPETIRYGGNTACIELNVADKRLILDAGTGIRNLGKQMMHEQKEQGSDHSAIAYLFFTQTQWDRIQGFPFFAPAFIEGNAFEIYGAAGTNGASIKQRLAEQMLRPNFSAPLHQMRAKLIFHDITPGSLISLDDIIIETISLSHSNSALGYRITWDGRSVVYAIDSAHSHDSANQHSVSSHHDISSHHAKAQLDPALLYLCQDADLLIFDTAYVDHDYYSLENTTHHQPESWKTGIEVAIAAQVGQVVMFHHDPTYEDDYIDQLERQAQDLFADLQFAREGQSINVI